MKKSVTLYNIILPVWLLFALPPLWPVVLAGNFGVDSLVLYIGMRRLAIEDKKSFYKKHIWKVWGCGFLGDLPGALFMILAVLLSDWLHVPDGVQSAAYTFIYENITNAVPFNPFSNIWSFLWVSVAVAISALCLYWLNYKLCYRRTELPDGDKKRLSLLMALVTAPWLFYLPTSWFYF